MKGSATSVEPVIKVVEVELPIEEAFELFTEGMGEWWPLHTHSIAADSLEGRVAAERLVFEPREGGRIYEVMSDGAEGEWGSVLQWDPPSRAAFSWKPYLAEGPFTDVEVRFSSVSGGTKVELEHSGWERLADIAPRRRDGYDNGWPGVLDLFREAATKKRHRHSG